MTTREKKEMTDWEIDQWSSHRLIMDPLLNSVHIRKAVELGAGRFSTRKLSEGCDNILSLENNQDWATEMQEELKDLKNLEILCLEEDTELWQEIGVHVPFDLLFVDHSGDRRRAVEEGMRHSIPYIILHDFTTEDEFAINVEDGYQLFSTRGLHFNPTAFYTNNRIVYSAFQSVQTQ